MSEVLTYAVCAPAPNPCPRGTDVIKTVAEAGGRMVKAAAAVLEEWRARRMAIW